MDKLILGTVFSVKMTTDNIQCTPAIFIVFAKTVASHIIEERTLRDGFKSLDELTKVEDFPIKKIEIIKLYLHL